MSKAKVLSRVSDLLLEDIGRSVPSDCAECHYNEDGDTPEGNCSYEGGGICGDMTECPADRAHCVILASQVLKAINHPYQVSINDEKIQALFEQSGIKPDEAYQRVKFYYIRPDVDEHGFAPHGTVTMCLIQLPDGKYVRGLAYCKPSDSFNRKSGRKIAEGYAVAAFENPLKTNSVPIPHRIQVILKNRFLVFNEYHSTYDTVLTVNEEKLFGLHD